MFSMWIAGRVMNRMDPRILVAVGISLVSFSLYEMACFNLQVSMDDIIYTGIVQGLGLGFLFVPISYLAYTTLSPSLRDEGASLFSLARNLGSSVGVSIVMATLSRNMWINQQELAGRMQVSPDLLAALPAGTELMGVPAAVMNELARGAAEISYANNFYLLMWVSLATLPLVLLLAKPQRSPLNSPD
jgi:DHA2 family multidrug resistance protein